jgi:hypothetical protein
MNPQAITPETDPRRNSQYYRILSHPLTISVLETHNRVLKPVRAEAKKSFKNKKKSKSKHSLLTIERPALTPEQEYHNAVFYYASNLTHLVERLEHIPLFIKRFPNTKTFKEQGITLHEWVHYHHSAYLITVIGIYDLALLIVNAILVLGIHPRKCSDKNVSSHPTVQKSKISSPLGKLRDTTKNYREPRNLLVHHGALPKLEMLDMMENELFIERTGKLLGIKKHINPIIHPVMAETIYQGERRELAKSIVARTVLITNDLYVLFDALHSIYLAYAAHLGRHGKE